ncbi:MAG: peptidylprolyl isomerase [Spirochaetota bacterium]
MKRHKQKKNNEKLTDVEKKRIHHPLIYAGSVIILVIIVVTFIGTPVADKMGNGVRITFGKYGNKNIEFYPGNYLSRQKDLIAEQLRENSTQQNFEWQAYQVWKTAFDRTAIHIAILDEGERSGLYVTDYKIDHTLTQYGPYMENGEFSEERYKNTSNQERYEIRKIYRENLLHDQYITDVVLNSTHSRNEIDFIKKMALPERSFRYVIFSFSDYPEGGVIDYGIQNPKLFRQMKLSRITIKSGESDAKTIFKQLEGNPAAFEDLAKTQSKDAFAEKGGEMGLRRYFTLQEDFASAPDLDYLFSLKKGEVSKVLKTTFGWAIYRCDEEATDIDLSNEESVNLVRAYMERYEAGKIEDFLVKKADEFRSSALAEGFDKAAETNNLDINTSDYFPVNYGNTFFLKQVKSTGNDKALESAAYKEQFFISAFSLKPNDTSLPLVLDKVVVVLQLADERQPSEDELMMIDNYYPYILQQYREEDMSSFFMHSKKFVDNFNEAFAKFFLPQE